MFRADAAIGLLCRYVAFSRNPSGGVESELIRLAVAKLIL